MTEARTKWAESGKESGQRKTKVKVAGKKAGVEIKTGREKQERGAIHI